MGLLAISDQFSEAISQDPLVAGTTRSQENSMVSE